MCSSTVSFGLMSTLAASTAFSRSAICRDRESSCSCSCCAVTRACADPARLDLATVVARAADAGNPVPPLVTALQSGFLDLSVRAAELLALRRDERLIRPYRTRASARHPWTRSRAARTLALQCPGTPLVLDADGLNAVAGDFPIRKEPGLVITPHPGEMARLTGTTIAQIEADRAGTALRFAESCNCVVVLKGHRTVIASPEGELAVNTTGNSGMARGGSGDLLAGMLGGLLAQGLAPFAAAKCAVWLHGKAGDLCAARLSRQAMLPHDMLDDLCAFLAQNGL